MNSQGIREPPDFKDNPLKHGLGYDPTKDQTTRRKGKSPLRPLNQIFQSGGIQASRATLVADGRPLRPDGCLPVAVGARWPSIQSEWPSRGCRWGQTVIQPSQTVVQEWLLGGRWPST
ncbi:unnamed protein product, partial [Sphenostylis stenocarpa]